MKQLIGSIAVLLAASALAQPPGGGAKTLFYNPYSNVATRPNEPKLTSKPPGAVSLGLRYSVDLVQADGSVTKTTSARPFHSGERVRLRVQSNLNGRFLLLLLENNGASRILFPDPRINDGNSEIVAQKETVIPAANATIQFDQEPRDENLFALVTSEAGFAELGVDWNKRSLDPNETARLLAVARRRPAGSKGLTVEVDDKSNDPATYVVAQCQPVSSKGMDVMMEGCEIPNAQKPAPPRVFADIRFQHKQ